MELGIRLKIEWEREITMGLTFNTAVVEGFSEKIVFE